ncbi:cytochrome P450 [Kitasatospora sp. NPDC093558]|uniref:cytochrome P450 n=1 Tax=Kitasatospora sp. NPDC093558 TaxID=3155201 RepID=UPI003442115D
MPHPDEAAAPASAQDQPADAEPVDRPFVLADPLAWFDDVREDSPVLWHPETASWYVTRFEDVWRLLLDERLGARSPDPFLRRLTAPERAAVGPLVDFLSRWPMFLDPPRHTAVRRVLRPAFTPEEVARVAGAVQQGAVVRDALAAAADGMDLLETLLRPACRTAVSALLGLAPGDVPRLVEWSEQLMGFVGRSRLDPELVRAAEQALGQFTGFTEQTLAAASSPLAGAVGGAVRTGVLQPADAVAIYAQLVTGALEPTVTALAVALEVLSRGPRYRQDYRDDPAGFVNEAVRLATPFHFAARRTLSDLTVRGQRIPAGARVVLVLVAANRDPRRFTAPLEFRQGRAAAHVAFGRGRHACLGSLAAQHTIRPVLDAYLAETDDPRPLDIEWHVTMGMKWPVRLTVRPA